MIYGQEREAVGTERWIVGALALLVIGGIGAELVKDFTPAKLSILFMLLGMPLLLAIHELGHAVVSRGLGWRVCRIVIGYGRPIWRTHVLRTPLEIRLFPIGGHVLPAPTRLRWPRLESMLIYAAGLGAELMVAGLVFAAWGPDVLLHASDRPEVIAAQSVLVLVALDLFTNLLPLPVTSVSGAGWTDGLGLVMTPFLPDWYFRRALTIPWALRAESCATAADKVRVLRLGVEQHPNGFMRLLLADALDESGDTRAAREERDAAVRSGDLPEQLAAEVQIGRSSD